MNGGIDRGTGLLAGFPAAWAAIGCLTLTAWFLPSPGRAEDTPRPVAQAGGFSINAGLNDAWFNPATGGQGFQISVFPKGKSVFLTWFTYDTVRPPEGTGAVLGGPDHRWLTAQGPYEGDTATLTIYSTTGGVFNAPNPVPSSSPAGYGTITLKFEDCNKGLLTFEITPLDLAGKIPIQRIATDNVPLCESLVAKKSPTEPPTEPPTESAAEPAELKGITAAHNAVRAAVGVAPLSWDPALAKIAQAWAEKCTDKEAPVGLIDHNPRRSDGYPGYVGENVHGAGGSARPKRAVDRWAAEQADYDYDTNTCAPGKYCGHYTQVVSAATERVGCGLANCAELTYGATIVCNYSPGGNPRERPY